LCGIHETTLKERIAELTQIYADRALKQGLAQRDKRVAVLVQMHEKLLQIVEERAADPNIASVPGGKTSSEAKQGDAAVPIGDRLLTHCEAAEVLRLSTRTVREYVKRPADIEPVSWEV
jgi:hypothetical protein